jgi:hypothetical protein
MRVMKARWVTDCPLCTEKILRGQQMARTDEGWAHTLCYLRVRNLYVA